MVPEKLTGQGRGQSQGYVVGDLEKETHKKRFKDFDVKI